MKKIAILGAGYTGLACAKKLSEKGYEVTIFEKTDELGGMAKCIQNEEYTIEKHYRHIYQSDKYIIDLIEELKLKDDLKWLPTQMAYYSKSGLYKFGTPISLLKYKPLTFVEKIKFGFSIIKLKMIKNYMPLEKYTVKEWIEQKYGSAIYEKIWKPLMVGKFGNQSEEVSMVWLWGKINLRSTNSTINGEKLGYMMGSWKKLTDQIEKYLKENKCQIYLNTEILKVEKKKNKYNIKAKDRTYTDYDEVVCALSNDIAIKVLDKLLTENEKEKIENVKYMSAKTLLLTSKKSISPYYWINIGDNELPFVGVIEHTNMVNKNQYNNENIIYISNYIDKENPMYKMSAEKLLEKYLPYLQKINEKITINDIINMKCFEEEFAQPIIEKDYTKNKLEEQLASGIFIANMAQIYPEDRGMNYAIKLGYNIAEKIIN